MEPQAFNFFANAPGLGLNLENIAEQCDFTGVEVSFGPTTQTFHIGRGSTALPLVLPGLLHLHQRYARLSLEQIVQPAIDLAKKGVRLSEQVVWVLGMLEPILRFTPPSEKLVAPSGELIRPGERYNNPELSHLLKNLAETGNTNYYDQILVEHFEDPIIKLARSLEGLTLEFKSSYKTPIEKSPIPEKILVKKLKHGVIKTIAAFANTKGGNLLIGVSDENKIVGIEVDKFKNTDEFIRGVTRQIEIDLKPNPMTIHDLINFSSTTKNGKTIVCINVKPASRPIYAYNKPGGETELLYNRKSASSESLTLRETVRYIKERFPDF